MRYYLRRDKNTPIQGPFSVSELDHGLATGAIFPESFASSDIGSGAEALRKFRRCDWFRLSEIPDLQEFYATPNKHVAVAQPPSRRRQVMNLLLAAMLTYSTATQHSWWAWAFAFVALVDAAGLIQSTLQRNRTSG